MPTGFSSVVEQLTVVVNHHCNQWVAGSIPANRKNNNKYLAVYLLLFIEKTDP